MSSTKDPLSLPKREILELSNALNRLSQNTEVLTQCCTALTRRTRQLTSLTTPASETSAALIQAASNVASTLTLMREARDRFDSVTKGELIMDKIYIGAKAYYEFVCTTTLTNQGDDATPPNVTNPITQERESTVPSRSVAKKIQRSLMFAVGSQNINNNNSNNIDNSESTTVDATNQMILKRTQDKQSGVDVEDDVHIIEQDVYAAADALELLKITYSYFTGHDDEIHKNIFSADPFDDQRVTLDRRQWKSTVTTLRNIEHAHQRGVDGMCLIIKAHLCKAGPAVRMKRALGARGDTTVMTVRDKDDSSNIIMQVPFESAAQARIRYMNALNNRDLMKSVGEYEESLPLTTRMVRELRAIFECLGDKKTFWGCALGDNLTDEMNAIISTNMTKKLNLSEVSRTEAVGSGRYCNICMISLRTGFPQLDAYAETRKIISLQSMDDFHNSVKNEHLNLPSIVRSGDDLDAAARDVVRCLEHTLVIATGEKSVYRCIVSPTSSNTHDQSRTPVELMYACSQAYAHVLAPVVDRMVDILEVFCEIKARLGTNAPTFETVRFAASAVAGAFRIFDGVRALAPSLTKMCIVSTDKQQQANEVTDSDNIPPNSVASILCSMRLYKGTMTYAARALEGLVKVIAEGVQMNPSKISLGVASLTSDVVSAIRLLCPYASSYKSVSKRKSFAWDPRTQEEAKDMDAFIKCLVMKLLGTLQTDASTLKKVSEGDAAVNTDRLLLELKANIYLMNNAFYLLNQLGNSNSQQESKINKKRLQRLATDKEIDGDEFKIESDWFQEVVGNVFTSSLQSYVSQWESLKKHLSAVDERSLEYQGGGNLLSLESGRILKARFNGFNEEYERLHNRHKGLIVENGLKEPLLSDIKKAFFGSYKKFFETYSKVQFSKKNMEDYLKYPPIKISQMLDSLFTATS